MLYLNGFGPCHTLFKWIGPCRASFKWAVPLPCSGLLGIASSSLESEAHAALLAVKTIIQHNFSSVILESDSKELICSLQITNLCHRFNFLKWSWINRPSSSLVETLFFGYWVWGLSKGGTAARAKDPKAKKWSNLLKNSSPTDDLTIILWSQAHKAIIWPKRHQANQI